MSLLPMSLLQRLETYHQLHPFGSSLYQKAGMRVLPKVVQQLFSHSFDFHANRFVDVTGGRFALDALQTKRAREIMIVEGSRATLRCLQKSMALLHKSAGYARSGASGENFVGIRQP